MYKTYAVKELPNLLNFIISNFNKKKRKNIVRLSAVCRRINPRNLHRRKLEMILNEREDLEKVLRQIKLNLANYNKK